MKAQFYNTSNRLIRDVTLGLGRSLTDANWIGGFCLPMIGSFAHECGGFEQMEEGKPTVAGSLGGISFAQWTGMSATGRRAKFMALCRMLHLHPYSYDAALAMILAELKGTAASVVTSTLRAPAFTVDKAVSILGTAGQKADRALLARVVKFEQLYENAGVKHYPSRYAFAIMARDAYTDWAKAGFPEPGKFVMPKSKFWQQFDKEFGRGESETTTRMPAIAATGSISPPLASGETIAFDPAEMPQPTAVRGRWPEDRLSVAEIKAIQARLRDLGYVRVGQIDGKWGTNTRASISALQAENGIAVDGHYGPATRAALAAGKKHVVAPERAQASAKLLLAAGEPTMTAVHPVSIGAKVLAGLSAAGTVVGYVADAWPQASAALDGVKNAFGNLPGWVWPLATLVIALYFVTTAHKVKAVAVDNFRSGANTALATPLLSADDDDPGAVLPPVPEPGDGEDATEAWRARTEKVLANMHPMTAVTMMARQDARITDLAGVEHEVFARDFDAVGSDPDRPLGVEGAEDQPQSDAISELRGELAVARRELSDLTWADMQRGGN